MSNRWHRRTTFPTRCCRLHLLFAASSLFFIASLSPAAFAQSVSGVPGLVRVPIATFHDDGTLLIGSSFLPREHLPYTGNQRDAIAAYAGLTFLSFIEVDLRVTRQLGVAEGADHVVDRVPTVRVRILPEKKWIPAIALGFHDVLTSIESGEAHHFGATYLVATKHFDIPWGLLRAGVTAGWGADRLIWDNSEFTGPFGGLSLSTGHLPWLSLLADYDGATVNAALRASLFKRLDITAGTIGFDSFTATLSYRFRLIR